MMETSLYCHNMATVQRRPLETCKRIKIWQKEFFLLTDFSAKAATDLLQYDFKPAEILMTKENVFQFFCANASCDP